MISPSLPQAGRSGLRRLFSLPAPRALLIQLGCFVPTLAALFALARLGAAPGYWHAALLQGGFAAIVTSRAGMARWWILIQFLFPLAVLLARALALPSPVFLAGFVVLLLVFWSTFRTQVPYYPSGTAVRAEVLALLAGREAPRVIDVGSGLGGLALALARARPDARVEGIELAPLPWLVSRLRSLLAGSRARFLRGDYEALDFGAYDLVYAYLSPAAMDGLWRKARREMRPGSVLASYEFAIEGEPPHRCVTPPGSMRTLYIWYL